MNTEQTTTVTRDEIIHTARQSQREKLCDSLNLDFADPQWWLTELAHVPDEVEGHIFRETFDS